MARTQDDNHFRQFAQSLEREIDKFVILDDEDFLARQKRQVETLVALEKEFRQTLIRHHKGPWVYKNFVKYICEEKRNILAARPFFRERQGVFTKKISKALKRKADKSLYRFHFNFEFVLFAMKQWNWPPGSKVTILANKIRTLRNELVTTNMPLAINRSRIFYSRTPKAQLAYMDLVQISTLGLMSAVDKFCLPFSKVFRSVAIGRMVGNFIEQYSETLVHFYPVDKRKIYRANKLLAKFIGDRIDFEKLASGVNIDVDDPNHLTNAAELADLVSAASCVSADAPLPTQSGSEPDNESLPLDTFEAEQDTHPDTRYEKAEALHVLGKALPALPMIDKKLLRMRGVSL